MVNIVILCGGSGSRLWPLSREKLPKQLLPIVNDYTMLQNTIQRCNTLNLTKITIICNIEHAFLIQQQVNELILSVPLDIIAEPIGRDTAPAVAVASLLSGVDDINLVVPCDHVFDDAQFVKSVKEGLQHCEGRIITFGIKPTSPETGYGYIKTDVTTNATIEFVEKPNYSTACEYVAAGNYFWNAGVFLFRTHDMLQCFNVFAPEILTLCKSTLEQSKTKLGVLHLSKELFSTCKAISIDYAIMEKICKDPSHSVKGMTIPYKYLWCDIGSFKSLHEYLLEQNEPSQPVYMSNENNNHNIVKGDVILHDTTNSYIDTEHSLVAVIGMANLVVVNTRDALLICDKNKTQDVKHVVNTLKRTGRPESLYHAKVYRPWGWYCNIEGNDISGFKVKRIAVYPGKKLSLQSHDKRSEHWVVVKGQANVQVGHDQLILHANQHVYIPKKTLHRMENIGEELLEFVETQIGEYLGEDDIVRYEDDFGRV
jgi:mannose-1-phosphate guanylyltransferase / mannose-6-phosphate isomerase